MSAVTINNFEIINDRTKLSVNVKSVTGSLITSVKLWNIDTFKSTTLAINLNYKLQQLDNTESFVVTAEELNLTYFTDIWFIEIATNYVGNEGCTSCQDPAFGITYDLQEYYKCMLNYLMETEKSLDYNNVNISSSNLTIPVSLMITSIEKSLEIGYYSQAIEMIKNLKKLCRISECKNCKTVKCNSCSKFIQQ